MINQLKENLILLKNDKPIILNLTNLVTMDLMANALLALGAAPIMSVCDEELEELIKITSCVNMNIGTLDKAYITRCNKVIELAKHYKKPIILDPVGAGCTQIRTKTACELMRYADIIKGNPSEILALDKIESKTLGVESRHTTVEAKNAAQNLAMRLGCVVVITGPIDYITDGNEEKTLNFGSSLMSQVTGMGCTLGAVIGAFRGVLNASFESAILATTHFGLCGQIAEQNAHAPGSFRVKFLDQLYNPNFESMRTLYAK